MTMVLIDSVHGPNVHLAVNGTFYTLATGSNITVTADQLAALASSRITYSRTYNTVSTPFATLTLSSATIAHTAAVADTVGTVVSGKTGSTFTLTNTATGKYSITGSTVKVAAALAAGTDNIEITETNSDYAAGTNATTIAITVT